MVLPTQRTGTATTGDKRGWRLFDFLMEQKPPSAEERRRHQRDGQQRDGQQRARQSKDESAHEREAERHPGGRAEAWQSWRLFDRARRRAYQPPARQTLPMPGARTGPAPYTYRPPTGPSLFDDELRLRRLAARCRAIKSEHARRVLVYCLALHTLHRPKAHELDVAV